MPRLSRFAAIVGAASSLPLFLSDGSATADETGAAGGAERAATCRSGDVDVIADLLNVRSGPSSTHSIITQVRRGEVLLCHGLVNGGGYLACGVSGDDRWAEVTAHGLRGYAASACLDDRFVSGEATASVPLRKGPFTGQEPRAAG